MIVNEDSEEDSKRLQSSEDESSVDEDDEKKAFKEKLYTFMKEKGRHAFYCRAGIKFMIIEGFRFPDKDDF